MEKKEADLKRKEELKLILVIFALSLLLVAFLVFAALHPSL